MRPRPSFVTHSRPEAPDISAEPALPSSAPEGKSLFVNVIRAVIPSGAGAARASWIACASGFGGGVGPLPPLAATAIAAPAAESDEQRRQTRTRRRESGVCGGASRRSFRRLVLPL